MNILIIIISLILLGYIWNVSFITYFYMKLRRNFSKKYGAKYIPIFYEIKDKVFTNLLSFYYLRTDKFDKCIHDFAELLEVYKKKYNFEEIKTSVSWQEICRVLIGDPDGWDRTNFNYSWYKEKITRKEFERRMCFSTCFWRIDLPKEQIMTSWEDNIWLDKRR